MGARNGGSEGKGMSVEARNGEMRGRDVSGSKERENEGRWVCVSKLRK